MADGGLQGRAFFEHQQQRRREAQARLTGKPLRSEPPPPPAVSPASATQVMSSAPIAPTVRLLVTSGLNAGRAFDLRPGELIIGRGVGSEILLEDPQVSQTHALLRVRGQTVTVEDQHSTNGTRVNGVVVEHPTLLAPGDLLDVGGVQLEVASP